MIEKNFGRAWAVMLLKAGARRALAGYKSTPTRSLNGREQRRAAGDYRTFTQRNHDAYMAERMREEEAKLAALASQASQA